VNDWLNVLQGASFVGLLIVTTYAGLQRGNMASLKESLEAVRADNADLRQRVEDRDGKLAEERDVRATERATDRERIGKLQEAVDVLKSTVTGETHLVTLEDLVTHMNEVLVQHHESAMTELHALKVSLDKLAEGRP
jgi:uncharacterized protein YlxW (UPF0749 family)